MAGFAKSTTGKREATAKKTNAATLGFETKLWQAADKMRNRQHETLFIDARKLGTMIDRVHLEGFSPGNIWRMRAFFLAWSGAPKKLTRAVSETGSLVVAKKLPRAVSEIPWGHNIILLQQIETHAELTALEVG